jgi:large subunit ribosomal protein L28e
MLLSRPRADHYLLSRIYKGVADKTAKNNYRADLREEAVARVSAVRRSQLPKKDTPAQKPRGAKARKAEGSE